MKHLENYITPELLVLKNEGMTILCNSSEGNIEDYQVDESTNIKVFDI